MDKTEQQDIIRTVNAMYKAHDYHGILALTKDVNPDKIRDRRALEMIADAYNKSGLYKEAREYLLIAYERFSKSRGVAYKLAVISVKLGNLDDSVDFYEDFCRLAPGDNNRYILKYIIGRAGGIEAKDLIKVLEIYNQKESDDRWMYELARLYHEVGRVDECVALCDEIALWYADGDFEKPALELKFMHKALSASQQARYEQIMADFVDEPAQPEEMQEASDEEIILEEEAESFVNEFIQAAPVSSSNAPKQMPLYEEKTERIFTEAKGKDPSVETFRIPVEKVNEVLEEQTRPVSDIEAFNEVDEKINEILGNRKKDMNRPRSFTDSDFEAVKEEIIKEIEAEEKDKTAPISSEILDNKEIPEEKTPEAAQEAEKKEEVLQETAPVSEQKPSEDSENAGIFEKQVQQFKDEPIIIEANHEDAAFAKLGVSALKRSKKASLIKKPSLTGIGRSFIEEPILKENVDTSDIPIANEEDGQIGINLVLLDKNDNDTIEGQLTIDEFFEQYAGKVAESKDHVAAVEAERLRLIQEAVKGMAPTPLYDMNFDTPDEEEFSEEEIITIVSDEELDAAAKKAAATEDQIAQTVAQILEAEDLSDELMAETEDAPQEASVEKEEEIPEVQEDISESLSDDIDNIAEEKEALNEEIEEPEAEIPEDIALPDEEQPVREDEGEAFKEPQAEETSEEETITQEEITEEETVNQEESEEISEDVPQEASAEEEIQEEQEEPQAEESSSGQEAETPQEDDLPQEEEMAAEEEPLSEETTGDVLTVPEDISVSEEEKAADEEPMDEGLAAALARFEESLANETSDLDEDDQEDSLFGFGDDLADLIMGTAPQKEEPEAAEKDELPPADEKAGVKQASFEISDEFRQELKEFFLIDGFEEEITTACSQIAQRKLSGDATGGNLIITGDKKTGKTYLAISVIKAVIKAVGIGTGKVVKVQAQPLNGKNISAVLKKIEGRDLIIENVGYLKDDTITQLLDVIRSGEFKQMIVLEGNMVAIENIILHFPEVEELFASRIDIHELTITQWANIAKRYAKEQGYIIDDMAALALHARIDKINVPNARLGLGDIKDIVDSAISKASKRNNGRLFAAFSKKNKEEIVLTESDFTE